MYCTRINTATNHATFASRNDDSTSQKLKRYARVAAIATLLSTAGCSENALEIEHKAAATNDTFALIHHPQNIRLTPAERKLEMKAQKLVGDYYEVEYLPKEKTLKITAGDICNNSIDDEHDTGYIFNMGNLREDLGIKPGYILKKYPQLAEVENQKPIYDYLDKSGSTFSIDNVVLAAVKLERQFVSATKHEYDFIDTAILVPGASIYIPISEASKLKK